MNWNTFFFSWVDLSVGCGIRRPGNNAALYSVVWPCPCGQRDIITVPVLDFIRELPPWAVVSSTLTHSEESRRQEDDARTLTIKTLCMPKLKHTHPQLGLFTRMFVCSRAEVSFYPLARSLLSANTGIMVAEVNTRIRVLTPGKWIDIHSHAHRVAGGCSSANVDRNAKVT